ncbi:MAG: magnesium chelatase subunit H, partial [Pseudomonadota bacterium]
TLQYMLAGSDENLVNLVRFLISRYAAGPREALRDKVKPADPKHYSEVGLYHPKLKGRVTDALADYHRAIKAPQGEGSRARSLEAKSARPLAAKSKRGTVGLIVMRSYVLARNTAHYDAVIQALEARGYSVVVAFASGLDARPAIDAYFVHRGEASVDAVVSLTGFSLVGGPAYNDSAAAEAVLADLDVPYLSGFAVEFQTLEAWQQSTLGLTPVESTMMVALPEIDGATGPMLFGGRSEKAGSNARDMVPAEDRIERLADRVDKLVRLRKRAKSDRKIAVVIYNFPPNGGAVGSAAFLSVFRSLFNTLKALSDEGYDVEVPADEDALRAAILHGNADRFGMPANVAATIDVDDHVRGEPHLEEIEAQWGAAPGRLQSDGRRLFVLGAHFGKVFVGVQPAMGYEGDPMRLLFEHGFAPTHAFSAFYRYLRADFAADAVLHFGTHGALEFMPGKQVGLSAACWPDRLIGDLPNIYLYAANNPSEGAIARRRSAATLVSYLTPPLARAGLYKGLADIKSSIDRWRALPPEEAGERSRLAEIIREQGIALDLVEESAVWTDDGAHEVSALGETVREYELTLIPHGLHVAGEPAGDQERHAYLDAVNEAMEAGQLSSEAVAAIAKGEAPPHRLETPEEAETARSLARLNADLSVDHELPALVRALDGRYMRPVAGGDVVRSPDIVPTGRNLHGFDPFRLPSAFAVVEGEAQAERLIERHKAETGALPRRLALVLWGTDNLKSEGAGIAQALALIGARPRFDGFGRLAGADLIALEELGRARIDVVITLSGIFRDLLPLQTRMLAEACLAAAEADEPEADNPIRAHALAYAAEQGCSLETAALRVFSNASNAYGSNVNLLIDSGAWDGEDELADAYTNRKCFAYGLKGEPQKQPELLRSVLKGVEAAYQNIDSVELGVTSLDHYFDTLGGIARTVRSAGGDEVPVYVGDQTVGKGKVRTLSEQVSLETRTRMLNPKWYEGLLDHGYEGVRQIESHVTNVLGWSATTGAVQPWVYKHLTETFVLDETMRKRLADLNPQASAKLAGRLIEAGERSYWTPDSETWAALCEAGDELEDRVEGLSAEAAA